MKETDLVITWVDGNDPVWQETFRQSAGTAADMSYLYRDWGWLPYWFRSMEKSIPWIRRIHFVTCGHLPAWLNIHHPKLHIVRHEDYIPPAYLPTFSSHTIEWNLYRIPDLAEQFILCSDDMFFLQPLPEDAYFRAGLPCDVLRICPVTESRARSFHHLLLNNMAVLNRHYDMHACAAEHPDLWFSSRYPESIRRENEAALCWNRFPGLYYDHMPMPLLKSSLEELWNTEGPLLDQICRRPMRDFHTDVNLYLARFWNLARGRFIPYCRARGVYCLVSDPESRIINVITGDTPLLCLNDIGADVHRETRKQLILSLFAERFPAASSFELPGSRV
ncbi:MAG: Stealth CR1 domain-containing protein [Solobacterium sp.]|nr:Stealth CR1 domain-containing protein [Solobacterium sp.]